MFDLIAFLQKNKRFFRNCSWLYLLQVASYIFPLLVVPYLIRVIGIEKYGMIAVAQMCIRDSLKALERKKLEGISESVVKSFVVMLLQSGGKQGKSGLSLRTVGNILTVLKAICSYGEKIYGCKNSARSIKLPKQKMPQEKVLTEMSWTKLTRQLKADKSETALAVAISLYTGMRLGEICALRTEDVELSERVIHVKQTVQRVRTGEADQKTKLLVQTPKSEHSERTIPIPEVILERLAEKVAQSRNRAYHTDGTRERYPKGSDT